MNETPAQAETLPVAARVPLLVLGMVSLVGGVLAGLVRLGWPVPGADWSAWHGPLMVAAFFGTVIGLERAVALGRRWAFLGPLASGGGGLLLISGFPDVAAPTLLVAAAIFSSATWLLHLRQPQFHSLVLLLAALLWLFAGLSSLLAIGDPLGGWIGFLVLTIAGERLELSRFLPLSPTARRVFAAIVLAMLPALLVSSLPWLGLPLLLLALWLLRQDVARRNVRQTGLTRFIAVCLLSGYFWLAFAAVAMLVPAWPFARDAALHAVFLGFVFAMVFGHAPVIFPAIVRVRLPYHAGFYLPLAGLHLSLLLRVAGDLIEDAAMRQWGGLLNAATLLLFVATMVATAWRGRTPGRPSSPG